MNENIDIVREECEVLFNGLDKANRYRMRLKSSVVINDVQPGQCLHLAVPGMEAWPIPYGFAVYDVDYEEGTIDVLYAIVGGATGAIARVILGQKLRVAGPYGEPLCAPEDAQNVLLASDDMGGARLGLLGRKLIERGASVNALASGSTYGAAVSFKLHGDDYGYPVSVLVRGKEPAASALSAAVAEELQQKPYDFVVCCAVPSAAAAVAETCESAGIPYQVLAVEEIRAGD